MNEWVVSGLVTVGGIALLVFILWLKEEHREFLVGVIIFIMAILVLIGIISVVHDFIYDLLPSMMAGN